MTHRAIDADELRRITETVFMMVTHQINKILDDNTRATIIARIQAEAVKAYDPERDDALWLNEVLDRCGDPVWVMSEKEKLDQVERDMAQEEIQHVDENGKEIVSGKIA